MQTPVPDALLRPLANAQHLYWAGRNDGVAEELTLKTNEITRRSSDFLEGTYALHGIEEVMQPGEALVVIEPFAAHEQAFDKALRRDIGLPIVAIAARTTLFPTLPIPDWPECASYLQLAAGWNLLVEIALGDAIDLDKPRRARKVGQPFRRLMAAPRA